MGYINTNKNDNINAVIIRADLRLKNNPIAPYKAQIAKIKTKIPKNKTPDSFTLKNSSKISEFVKHKTPHVNSNPDINKVIMDTDNNPLFICFSDKILVFMDSRSCLETLFAT